MSSIHMLHDRLQQILSVKDKNYCTWILYLTTTMKQNNIPIFQLERDPTLFYNIPTRLPHWWSIKICKQVLKELSSGRDSSENQIPKELQWIYQSMVCDPKQR